MRLVSSLESESAHHGQEEESRTGTRRTNHLVVQRGLVAIQHTAHCLTLLSLLMYLCALMCEYHWTVTLRPLLASHRWEDEDTKRLAQTYYPRNCNHEDVSTSNFTDLIVPPTWDYTRAAENILTHGVSMFPNIIDRTTADGFRNFTLEKNARMSKEDLVYVMNTYTHKKKQTRWAFAFTAHDHPSTPLVLKQVVENDRLRQTLEFFLGPDPALIKMQTITAAYKAEHQGWHSDVNPKASVKSHARSFMPHFSLFIPLQDTTFDMGSTGVCPGSHYCSSMVGGTSQACGQVFSGFDPNDGTPIWFAGDAVLMNQNTFHRGWEYSQRRGPHRAIIVLTFTSRPRRSDGGISKHPTTTPLPQIRRRSSLQDRQEDCDLHNTREASSLDARRFPLHSWKDEQKFIQPETRSLSLGTPLTSFGHTMDDFRDPLSRFSTILTRLRLFGIYKPPNAHWGWTYVASIFSRISTETHKFKKDDLSNWLSEQHRWNKERHIQEPLLYPGVYLLHLFRRWYLTNIISGKVPTADPEKGIWDVWYIASLRKAVGYFTFILLWNFCGYVVICLLSSCFTDASSSSATSGSADNAPGSGTRKLRRQQYLAEAFGKFLRHVGYLALLLVGCNWMLLSSTLIRDIRSGQRTRSPFPTNSHDEFLSSEIDPLLPPSTRGVRRKTQGNRASLSTIPDRNDVLIGTRFDSLYLRSMNRFLDYHTGNKEWRKRVRDHAAVPGCENYSLLSLSAQTAIAESIVRKIKGRFLVQNPNDGSFAVLSVEESVLYTRRALISETNALAFELDQTISFIISHMRFESSLRTTYLARTSVARMNHLRKKIYHEDRIQRSVDAKVRLPKMLSRTSSLYFLSGYSMSRKKSGTCKGPLGSCGLGPKYKVTGRHVVMNAKAIIEVGAIKEKHSRLKTRKATPDGKRIVQLYKKQRR